MVTFTEEILHGKLHYLCRVFFDEVACLELAVNFLISLEDVYVEKL